MIKLLSMKYSTSQRYMANKIYADVCKRKNTGREKRQLDGRAGGSASWLSFLSLHVWMYLSIYANECRDLQDERGRKKGRESRVRLGKRRWKYKRPACSTIWSILWRPTLTTSPAIIFLWSAATPAPTLQKSTCYANDACRSFVFIIRLPSRICLLCLSVGLACLSVHNDIHQLDFISTSIYMYESKNDRFSPFAAHSNTTLPMRDPRRSPW